MASTEVIQKEVTPNPEVKDSPEIIQNETSTNLKSKEPDVVASAASSVQAQQQQQQQQPVQHQEQQQNQQPVARTCSSREEKMRKKDDKSVDHVLKALNSLNTTEEKLAAMCKKYADIFDENRKLQLALKQAEKRCGTLQREKEQLQTEHSKAILTRSRLENLCRELQRQNKAIKDESLLKIREEEEKRKEVSAKFQATLNEITTLMQQNNDKNMKLRDDNIDMNAKLKNVCEQYELREQQVEKISKQMQLEAQLADAKLAKAKMEMAAEREIMLREKQQLLMELSQYQARCQEFQATEISLRSQISMYDDKYDEFQKALARSNEVFGGFKGEMEKMSKKMCKLEKEVSTWKQRWEGSHKALLEMAEEKQKADQDLNQANRQVVTLQRLCRTLQGERSNLLAKLKGNSPADGKIDVSIDKIQDTIGKADNEQLTNSNLQNSPQQQLVNGDTVEKICVNIDGSSEKRSDNSSKISNADQNGITESAVTGVSVPNESTVLTEKLPDSSNKSSSEILIEDCFQSSPVTNVDSNISQLNEQNISKEPNLASLSDSDSSVTNCVAASPENVISSDSPTLPVPVVTESGSSVVISDVSTSVGERCSSDSNMSVAQSTEQSTTSQSSPIVAAETNSSCPNPSVESLVTNSLSSDIASISSADKKPDENVSSNISADNISSVEYTVADVLKTKVLPAASHDNVNKQPVLYSDSSTNKEDGDNNCSSELKQISNEQPVKKQSTEPKKGKESRKKKKNT